jgi:two-component system chemotaxis response regulator CheB
MSDTTPPLVTIGASAGGIEAVGRLLGQLPPELPAAVLVVVHISPTQNRLVSVLGRASNLPVAEAVDGEKLLAGHVYVAAPDRHLLVEGRHMRVVRGPEENGHRPAIDPLFRTAAEAGQPGLVAVVLTGSLDDGAAGSAVVSRLGGHVLVQDPDEAAHPSMPLNAIAIDDPDDVLPLDKMPAAIIKLVTAPRKSVDERSAEHESTGEENAVLAPFGCPTCGGALWEAPDTFRFRCRIGHAFGPDSLFVEKSNQLDTALAVALRALEERAEISKRIAERLRRRGIERRVALYEETARESIRQARVIRNVLLDRNVQDASPEV